MSEHFSNNEIENFINGKYPLKEVFKISQHIIQCLSCQDLVNKFSPMFFQEPAALNAESKSFENEKHYTFEEIIGFLRAELPLKQRLQMSDHIRECTICKTKLYEADPNYLKQTIKNYLDREDDLTNRTVFSGLFTLGPILAFALVIAFLIGFLFINRSENSQNEFQAKINEKEIQETSFSGVVDNSANISVDNSGNQKPKISAIKSGNSTYSLTSNKSGNLSKNKVNNSEKPLAGKFKSRQKDEQNRKILSEGNVTVSESRSLSNPCSVNNLKIALSPYFERITETQPSFHWKAVSNAVKYQIYISDQSKVLIDQFQTTKDTTYTSKVPYNEKNYKWQVIVTLSNGKSLNSGLIDFSIGKDAKKFALKGRKKEKENDPNRCLQ